MIIGITGGSGSGKTTLLNLIRDLGGMVLDCDGIYHTLLRTDRQLLARLDARFPGTVKDGQLNRKALGALVFSDPIALEDLNQITHSAVRQHVLLALEAQPPLAAIDAIGLFEGDLAALCQVTVAVTAPREQRIARLVDREQIPPEYARQRIDAQKSDAWFQARCDYTLENNGTKEEFRQKCLAFLEQLGIMNEEK